MCAKSDFIAPDPCSLAYHKTKNITPAVGAFIFVKSETLSAAVFNDNLFLAAFMKIILLNGKPVTVPLNSY